MSLTLHLLPDEFAVCRLPPTEPIPKWADSPVFSSIIRTGAELSIICPAAQVPANVKHEAGWQLLKIQGPFAFTETGILASVLAPLAAAKIGILAVSTFETDYLLVKSAQVEVAQRVLAAAGHIINDTPPVHR